MSVLTGKRILVVEDEFLVALEAENMLVEAGAHVVGPAYQVDAALDLVEAETIDGALLDVNLGGVVNGCRAFARRLVERGTGGHIVNVASISSTRGIAGACRCRLSNSSSWSRGRPCRVW